MCPSRNPRVNKYQRSAQNTLEDVLRKFLQLLNIANVLDAMLEETKTRTTLHEDESMNGFQHLFPIAFKLEIKPMENSEIVRYAQARIHFRFVKQQFYRSIPLLRWKMTVGSWNLFSIIVSDLKSETNNSITYISDADQSNTVCLRLNYFVV